MDPASWAVLATKAVSVVKGAAAAWKTFAAAKPLLAGAIKIAAYATVSAAVASAAVKTPTGGGQQLEFKADPQAGYDTIVGRTAVGGFNILGYPSGSGRKKFDNAITNLFPVISGCGPIAGPIDVEMNTFACPYNNSTGQVTSGEYKDKMWVKTALGAVGASATALTAPAWPSGWDISFPEWTAAHKGQGFAHAWVSLWQEEGDKSWSSGIQPRFIARGALCYDPRFDSTYPGGSGPQRVNDQTTWAYSENGPIVALTHYIGWRHNGVLVGGAGLNPAFIDIPAFVAAANVAQVNGWTIGGTFNSLEDPWVVGKRMLAAVGCEPIASGALLSCIIHTPRTSVGTVTIDDVCGPFSIPSVKPMRDRINSVIPRCRLETHNWEVVSLKPVTVPQYVTDDGRLRQRELEYEMCQNAQQAAQLAAYDIVNAREFGPIALTLKPKWLGVQVGDAITLHLPEAGLNNQLVIVKSRQPNADTAEVILTVESETTSKHAFALGQTPNPPPTPGLTKPDYTTPPVPEVGVWAAEVGYAGSGSGTLPAITISGGLTETADVKDILVEYREVGTEEWIVWATVAKELKTITITGLKPLKQYEIAIRYRTAYGLGDRLIIATLTTGDLKVGDRDAQQVLTDIDLNAETLLAYLYDVQVLTDWVNARLFVDGQPVNAVVAEEIQTRIDAISALAQKLALVGVAINGNTAWKLNADIVYGDDDKLLVQSLTQLRADMDDFNGQYAEIISQLAVVVTPDAGAVATAVLQLDVNGRIASVKAINTGEASALRARFDVFQLEDTAGNPLFTAAGGKVTMPNVTVTGELQVDTIQPVQSGYDDVKLISQAQAFATVEYINDTNGNYCAPYTGYPSGRQRFVQMCELGNSAALDPGKRIRNGTRTFVVSGSASVDAYCSVWYQTYDPATSSWGAPVYVARGVDNASGVGNVTVPGGVDIVIPPNGSVRFYLSVNRGGLGSDAWDAATGNRSMENLNLLVTSVNF
ncbi:fibronectin type III domain-containing protein [Asticcacaulis excentricus]|uniref:Uncharacterized protein n=1 Tax=Asticcacaulis excentricus (strain ATCC 15261 / DSM 4724 / KCTC 12464 / NCIMB 9791 / VKM B-1370 / CB 48) TaxID=573065 RepID=E8RPR6_ASTEC|nr:fibronectin type III domain-containing protein [Asticcacaulis excentricus]ADU12043.1 hypothetical protein Astex_0345 [Asticcacaulis excentricus CB 48]